MKKALQLPYLMKILHENQLAGEAVGALLLLLYQKRAGMLNLWKLGANFQVTWYASKKLRFSTIMVTKTKL